jgi:hypothetical protein
MTRLGRRAGRRQKFDPALVLLATLVTAGAARAIEPHPFVAFLTPETSSVRVDSTFVVTFQVGTPAEHFNGYTVVIRFDPARLQFVSVAEGSLMLDGAPSRFAFPEAGDSTITYTHILLGNGLFVSGPGELSRFTFRALSPGVSPLDIVSDPHCTFFDDGLCVNDDSGQALPRTVTLSDAVVVIGGAPVGAPDVDARERRTLLFRPNPARGAGEFVFTARRAGPTRLIVVDVAGHAVLSQLWDDLPPGPSRIGWTGRDAQGSRVPAGVYFARLEDEEGVRTTRVVVLR